MMKSSLNRPSFMSANVKKIVYSSFDVNHGSISKLNTTHNACISYSNAPDPASTSDGC